MRGKAGAGKSTMMKFVYLETKKVFKEPSMAVASFFFNARGDHLEKSISGMYRSLLLQLLQEFPDIQYVLDNTDIVPRNQQDCPNLNALKELLSNAVMALGQRSFTCFIDALDECDEQEVRDMVQFFEDLAENTTKAGIRLRICFSSRPYPYISIRKGISLTLEAESGHVEDLAQYVKSKLTIEDPVLFADLQSEILGKASGIFLWIVLVVDILNKEDDDGGLALRTKLSTIPDKLSDLFRSILMRDRKSPERLLLCVLWILCAKRPLTPEEFRHALWVALLDHKSEQKDCQVDSNIPDVKNMNTCVKLVTSSSKGLAEITKAGRPIVQFVHESVRDFLVKERGLQDLWPELGFGWEGIGHERLRRCCTQYLSLSGVRAIVNGPEDRAARDTLAQKYSFLEYASQHVLHHSNIAALVMPNPQDDFLSQFFASGGIGVLNLFEGHKARRYGVHATPLYVLADKGLENLIRIRMKQESAKKESAAYTRGERYKYPFFAALANSHKGAVAALLGLSSSIHDGVDITEGFNYRKDLTGYQGRTPLSWAAQEGRLNIVKLLIRGADLDGIDERGYTPLRRALEKGQEAVARLLIDKGADVNAQDSSGSTALILASEDGYEAVARLLIEKGADVNAQGSSRSTALILALRNGYEAVARVLIEKGADVNAQDSSGSTALILALQNDHEAVARLLIEKGADVNAQNSSGSTPLIKALRNGYEAVARLLIEKEADVNAQGSSGSTALILASQNGHEAIKRLLIDNRADVKSQNKQA